MTAPDEAAIRARREARLENKARQMVGLAPFWGPPPGSNRWAELDYAASGSGRVLADGRAVEFAIRRGWLLAKRHDAPGFVLGDDPLGGALECHWRYRAAPGVLEGWRREIVEVFAEMARAGKHHA